MEEPRLSVAVTGEIGSGKTYACEYMLELNNEFSYINADRTCKDLYSEVEIKLLSTFGTADRREIADIVFKYKEERQKLDNILWPAIRKKIDDFISKNNGVILAEIPLLYESEWYKEFDRAVYIKCDYEKKLERALNRPNNKLTEEHIKKILELQTRISPEEKEELSEYTISNNGTLDNFQSKLERLCKNLKRDAHEKFVLGLRGI